MMKSLLVPRKNVRRVLLNFNKIMQCRIESIIADALYSCLHNPLMFVSEIYSTKYLA